MTFPLENRHLFPQTMEEAINLLKSGGYELGLAGTHIENSEQISFYWREDSMRNGHSNVRFRDFHGTYKEVDVHAQTLLELIELQGIEWKKLTQLAKWRKYKKKESSCMKSHSVVFGRMSK